MNWIEANRKLRELFPFPSYVAIETNERPLSVRMDGYFEANDLEAIASILDQSREEHG